MAVEIARSTAEIDQKVCQENRRGHGKNGEYCFAIGGGKWKIVKNLR